MSRQRRARWAMSCCARWHRACGASVRTSAKSTSNCSLPASGNQRGITVYTVVTGAAGFIGSNLVKGLNARGETRILAVDNLANGDKFRNLVDCEIADYLDQDEFLQRLRDGDFDDEIAAVLHHGACSGTRDAHARYMLSAKHRHSPTLR